MIKPLCPRCSVGLSRKVYQAVPRYSCDKCLGFAVSMTSLSKVMSAEEIKNIWTISETESDGCACPLCRQKMKSVFISQHGVGVDLCRRCKYVWLDTGEFSEIEEQALNKSLSKKEMNIEYGKLVLAFQKNLDQSLQNASAIEDSLQTMGRLSKSQLVAAMIGSGSEEDKDDFQTEPWITWGLVVVCILLAVTGFSSKAHIIERYSFSTLQPLSQKLFKSITSFFLMGDLKVFISNMFILWVFGDNVEDHLGKHRYLGLLLASTLLGNFCLGFFNPNAGISVGASGAAVGVMFYYIILFPYRRFIVRSYGFSVVTVPAFLYVFMYLLNYASRTFGSSSAGLTNSLMIPMGGAIAGVLFALFHKYNLSNDGNFN